MHLCMCAGDERVLGQPWSSRHRGGCLPRTHPPVLRPDRGRCAALPLATELLQWIPSRPPCNVRCGGQGVILFTRQHVVQARQATSTSSSCQKYMAGCVPPSTCVNLLQNHAMFLIVCCGHAVSAGQRLLCNAYQALSVRRVAGRSLLRAAARGGVHAAAARSGRRRRPH